MRDLAARSRTLAGEAQRYEREVGELVRSLDATLLDEPGIGPISAGTEPLPASSGKTVRHRLNRGGDRQVNNAIHTIAVIRAKHEPETRAYLDRRIREGKTKREAPRALKRHLSRDLFKRLVDVPLTS